MKKTTRISSFILVAVLCLSVFIGLTRNNTVTNANALGNSDTSVGVSLTSIDDEVIDDINAYIQYLYPNGNVTVTVEDAGNNVNNQITQLTGFIVQQVDAIVVKPVNESALDTVLTNANNQGIAVIILGRNHGYFPFAVYVDYDYASAAEYEVNYFLDNYWDPSKISDVLLFACYGEHGDIYYNTVTTLLADYSDIIIIHDYRVNGSEDARSLVTTWLANNGNRLPDAMFNCCASTAQGVKRGLDETGHVQSPNGMPLFGLRSYTQNSMNMVDFIKNLLHGLLVNGDSIPANQTLLFGFYSDGNWGSL